MDASEATMAAIAELEEQRYRAMLGADVETLTDMLAEDVVYTHSNSERDTKASYLQKIATRGLEYVEVTRPEERIVVAGDTAIVAGQMIAHVRIAGADRHLDNKCLAVWARCAGRWRLLAFQGTVIPNG